MKEQKEIRSNKKSIYTRTMISLISFYIIAMLMFTYFYGQMIIAKTLAAQSNKLGGIIVELQPILPEYETNPSAVNMRRITSALAYFSEGAPVLYGKTALFSKNHELIAKSGNYLGFNAGHITSEPGIWQTDEVGFCLDDYLEPSQIEEIFQFQDGWLSDENAKDGDIREIYEIQGVVYVKGNEIKPKNITILKKSERLTARENLTPVWEGTDRWETVRDYNFQPDNIEGFQEHFFSAGYVNGPVIVNSEGWVNNRGITAENLEKRNLCNEVTSPKLLTYDLTSSDLLSSGEYSNAEGFWQIKATDISYFTGSFSSEDGQEVRGRLEAYYAAIQTVFYPWPVVIKDLLPIYIMAFLLIIAIGLLLSKKLWNIYIKQERLEKSRRQMTDGIAHDLKTPIALISAYTEGLKENINDKKTEYLDVIYEEAQRMDDMIVEMLTLSKLEAGAQILHLEKIELNSLAKSEVKKYEGILGKKDITVQIEERGIFSLDCDKAQMTKVFHNILSNSVRHCEGKGEINFYINESGIEIINTGECIPDEKLGYIWDAYYKADESRGRDDAEQIENDGKEVNREKSVNENMQGSGLGLAIVKQILDLHGLRYRISNIENGVSVWFGK